MGRTSVPSRQLTRRRSASKAVTRNTRASSIQKILPKIIDSIEIQDFSDLESDVSELETNQYDSHSRTSSITTVAPKIIDSIEIQDFSDLETDVIELNTDQQVARYSRAPSTSKITPKIIDSIEIEDFSDVERDFVEFQTNQRATHSRASSTSKIVSQSVDSIEIQDFLGIESDLTEHEINRHVDTAEIINLIDDFLGTCEEVVSPTQSKKVSDLKKDDANIVNLIDEFDVDHSSIKTSLETTIVIDSDDDEICISDAGSLSKSNETLPTGTIPVPQFIAPAKSNAAISSSKSVCIDHNANEIDLKHIQLASVLLASKPRTEVKRLKKTKGENRKKRHCAREKIELKRKKQKSGLLIDDVHLWSYFKPLGVTPPTYSKPGTAVADKENVSPSKSDAAKTGSENLEIDHNANEVNPKLVTGTLLPKKKPIEVKRLQHDDHSGKKKKKKRKKKKKKSKLLIDDLNLLRYFQPLSQSIQKRLAESANNHKDISASNIHLPYSRDAHSTTVPRSKTTDANPNTIPNLRVEKMINLSKNVKQEGVTTVLRRETTDSNLNSIPDLRSNFKQGGVATVLRSKTTDSNSNNIPDLRNEKTINPSKNVKQEGVATVLRSKTADTNSNNIPDLRNEKTINPSKNVKHEGVPTVLRSKATHSNSNNIPDLRNEKIVNFPKHVKQEFGAESENLYDDISESSEDSIRLDVGANVFVPNGVSFKGRRPVIIDGSNVAYRHGVRRTGEPVFSSRGIEICAQYFVKRGHKVIVFIPTYRRHHPQTRNPEILQRLAVQGLITFTPSQETRSKRWMSYDDRFIVQCAVALGGVIVSNDRFRDLSGENPTWRDTIENRVLMFTFVGDELILRRDPLRARGIELEQLLRFPEKIV